MKEELLHFIWQSKVLLTKPLRLTNGKPLVVLKPGILNRHAGPDFSNASIRIGDTTWFGQIEIHLQSSDWYLHQHEHDPAYGNVILHVVYHHNREVHYPNGIAIPTLEIRELLPPIVLERYRYLQQNKQHIPCEKIFSKPPDLIFTHWIERLLVQRIERKTQEFERLLTHSKNDWEQAFYLLTARYMGMPNNAQPFEWLAQRIPLTVVNRCRSHPEQLLALYLGVAGLLRKTTNPESSRLNDSYLFLKHKYQFRELPAGAWKTATQRPAGFPVQRVTQFARLMGASTHLFSRLIRVKTTDELRALYLETPAHELLLSRDLTERLLLNVALPVRFLYGKSQRIPELMEQTLDHYRTLPGENNKVIRFWKQLGLEAAHAFDSQALLELKAAYCDQLKCVDCVIGQHLLLHESPALSDSVTRNP